MTPNQLPPLPPAAVDEHNLQGGRLLYTRQQMHAYALAALAQQAQEPVAWLVSLPDEPELGEWFSEQDMSAQGYTSKPLYTAPQPQPAPQVLEVDSNAADGPVKATPYNPTHEMMFEMKRVDPALSFDECRDLWAVAWTAAPKKVPPLRPQAVPMTPKVWQQWRFIRDRLNTPGMYQDSVGKFVEWFEAHHRITAPAGWEG